MRFNRALALAIAGRPDEALAEARRVVARRDNHWPAWRLIGRLTEAAGDDAAAIEAYLASLSGEPRAPGVREALIEAYQRTGQAGAAAQAAWPDKP